MCSPSVPSCCSVRSSTATRHGWASSSRRTGSTRSSRSRSVTTSGGSRRCCAACSTTADAVIMCGGLGPTHDDLTRDAIAAVMQVELVRDDAVADVIREMFVSRGRRMSENNLRQAMVPGGCHDHPADTGYRTRFDLPGRRRRCRQGRLRGPGRAPRDAGHVRAGHPAELKRRGRRPVRDREPGPAHLGGERERPQRAPRRRDRRTRRGRQPDPGVPGERLERAEGAHHRQGVGTSPTASTLLDEWEARVRAEIGDIVFGTDDDIDGVGRTRPAASSGDGRSAWPSR